MARSRIVGGGLKAVYCLCDIYVVISSCTVDWIGVGQDCFVHVSGCLFETFLPHIGLYGRCLVDLGFGL